MALYPAISVRQPWAWLIAHGFKDVENRVWRTRYQGPLLIHAGKEMTQAEYSDVQYLLEQRTSIADQGIKLPGYKELARGGIVGCTRIVDCVQHSTSPWYMGDFAFVLEDSQPVPFYACKGQLSIFKVGLADEICATLPKYMKASKGPKQPIQTTLKF